MKCHSFRWSENEIFFNPSLIIQRQWLARGCNASHQAILKQRRSSRGRTTAAAALLVEPYLELMTILLGMNVRSVLPVDIPEVVAVVCR